MENQEQNPLQQEQPFIAAKQVGFNLKDILLNTNNEVALLYPEHNNKDYFKCVSDFISKCCLRKPFTRSPNMYKEYLAEFWNAIGAHYLPHFSEYVSPPSIDVVRQWFPMIGYEEEVSAKGTLRKSLLPPRWSLANGINIDYANIFWEDIIIKLKKKQWEKVVAYTRFLSLLIMHKMKEGYRDDEVTLYPTQVFSVNNWALKSNQPKEPPFTDHMLAICAADKPVSASGNDASAVSTAEANPGNSAPSDFVPQQQGINEGTKNTSFDHLFAGHVASVQAKLKTLDALPDLLSHVTKALNKFAYVLDSAFSKAGDQSVPSAGQADTMPAKGEKNTNQATISQLFQKRAKKVNLNRPQPETTTPPPIPPVITTTTSQMQSPSFQPPPKSSSQPEGEHIKEDKGKKALSLEEAEKESTKSGFDDETTQMSGSMCTKENREEVKAEAARREGEIRKEELIDLLGLKVVNKYYNDKLQYDKYCDKMLNRRAASRITNCDVLNKKGPITLKVYREDGTNEIIPNFKASDLHLGEWRKVMEACPKRTVKG
ncbi:hypothetical protein Tco_0925472 [Tanacetum coccineum]|uniref:Uncharacterized protein n=1 Tax=Tanacetum coccineum TaxID=301880 RepID=A0ABQ5D9S0_9ASTR